MRRVLLVFGVVALAACEKKLAGPTPAVSGLTPGAVCTEQLDTVVTISGERLAPLLTGALVDGERQLELPRVSLVPAQALDGSALSGAPLTITDDPKEPGASLVRWSSQQSMRFRVVPALAVSVGLHDVVVENAQGEQATLSPGLLALPPPVLSASTPDLVCGEQECTVVLSGEGFVKAGAAEPTVRIGMVELAPTAMERCAALPGPTGYERCQALRLVIPANTLPLGTHPVSVTNPAPVNCGSSEAISLTVVPAPVVNTIEEDLVCVAEGANALTVTGTGFLTVGAANPMVRFTLGAETVELPTTASNCQPVTGPAATVQTCTTLTASLPQDALLAGAWSVTVTNPPPADCTSDDAVAFLVVPPPVLTAVAPQLACNAEGAVAVTLFGSGFLTIDGVAPTVDVGGTLLSATATGCSMLTGSTRAVESCTTLAVSVPSTIAPGSQTVTVINPAPAPCRSSAGALVLFARPVVTRVAPAGLCTTAGTTEIVVSGTGFLAVTSGTTRNIPSVTVGAQAVTATTSACAALTGVPDVEVCGELHFLVNGTAFTPGVYDVRVTNPAPVGCTSQPSTPSTFTVTAPPTISSVLPTSICAGGDSLSLTGSGFLSSSSVTLINGSTTFNAASVTVNPGGTAAVASFAAGLTTGQYTVSLSNGGGCSATAASPVTVIPGPQLFFVDPEIVYNGLTVQATVYGTGFTLPVSDLALLPEDGGAPISLSIQQATQVNRAQVLMKNVDGGVLPAGRYGLRLDDGTTCNAELASAVRVVDQTTLVLRDVQPPFGALGESTGVTLRADLVASGDAGFVAVPRVYLNPSTPGPNTVASPVGAVAHLDPETLTAVVPGTLPTGTYDVIVVNPDGRVGVKLQGFVVMSAAQPPPRISTVTPGSVSNTNPQQFQVLGSNFRSPTVTLFCFDQNGVPLATSPAATVTAATAASADVSFNASVAGAGCVVRVTNPDNQTWDEFSALVVTNPALNLYPAATGPALTVARRAPVTLGGDATNAARFLYVVGGDDGTGTVHGTVDTSALSRIGLPGVFATQRQGVLNQPRTLSAGARIGRWLYVAGGTSGTAALSSVERAFILDPERRGEVVDLLIETDKDAGLAAGLYYYRVAAVMSTSDAFNPGGEELASDPFPVRLPAVSGLQFKVTVSWAAVPGAASYRVYRSPVAGATVGTERVIAEVTGSTQYRDEGGAPISQDSPLPVGSLGKWQTLTAALSIAREGAGVAWGLDPASPTTAYLYVVGGRQSATTVSNTYEFLPLTLNADGSQTPAATFTVGTITLSAARWQLGASRANADLSSRVASGVTYIYALGGVAANDTTLVSREEAGQVTAGGQLKNPGAAMGLGTTFQEIAAGQLLYAGYASFVAANLVFAFGGLNASPSDLVASAEICGAGSTSCGVSTPPSLGNFNTGQTMSVARYLLGGSLHGAYIYVTGGVGTGGAALRSTEYRIW